MSKYVELAEPEMQWLRHAVGASSTKSVAREIEISEQTLLRMLAGSRVQRLTVKVLRQHMATVPAVQL
jgi:hypothetical protein